MQLFFKKYFQKNFSYQFNCQVLGIAAGNLTMKLSEVQI